MDLDNRFRVAVDIGGTFTDIAQLTDGALIQSKISSTPADHSIAVIDGVAQLLAELSIAPRAIAEVLHGTTVGSNKILQRKGAKTGLTTRGFRDVLGDRVASACPTC
jgi:N-methylhydantoinase A